MPTDRETGVNAKKPGGMWRHTRNCWAQCPTVNDGGPNRFSTFSSSLHKTNICKFQFDVDLKATSSLRYFKWLSVLCLVKQKKCFGCSYFCLALATISCVKNALWGGGTTLASILTFHPHASNFSFCMVCYVNSLQTSRETFIGLHGPSAT